MLIMFSSQALSPVSSWNWLCDTSVAGDITSVQCGWIGLTRSFTSAYSCIILGCPLKFSFLLEMAPQQFTTFYHLPSMGVHSLLTIAGNWWLHTQAYSAFKLRTCLRSSIPFWCLMPTGKNERKHMCIFEKEQKKGLLSGDFLLRCCDE